MKCHLGTKPRNPFNGSKSIDYNLLVLTSKFWQTGQQIVNAMLQEKVETNATSFFVAQAIVTA